MTKVAIAPTGTDKPITSGSDGSQYLLYDPSIYYINLFNKSFPRGNIYLFKILIKNAKARS